MPQMSPMWWFHLMLIFILCLMVTNSMIYFNYLVNDKKSNPFTKSELVWKW
uniref:ATP synthase F0 subunit 8 n=1 Tax=Apphia nigricarina TaxID=1978023 RepID=UPI00286D121C|nr:ATP synthase F0 subunit 8 [Apphia nigricarina]WKK49885.1 ATP synthase F0 subunit 8 [Apphia nigricarina]